MDTPTIAAYYREYDPMERLKLLEQSIQAGEEPEKNEIRKELWEIRYSDIPKNGEQRADGFFILWMAMEYNKNPGKRLFGVKSARKELGRHLEKLQFAGLCAKGSLYQELLYRECCHLVRSYMDISMHDRNYNSTLFGIMTMSKDRSHEKLANDIYETAIALPREVNMEEELAFIIKAAREVYTEQFSSEKLPE